MNKNIEKKSLLLTSNVLLDPIVRLAEASHFSVYPMSFIFRRKT